MLGQIVTVAVCKPRLHAAATLSGCGGFAYLVDDDVVVCQCLLQQSDLLLELCDHLVSTCSSGLFLIQHLQVFLQHTECESCSGWCLESLSPWPTTRTHLHLPNHCHYLLPLLPELVDEVRPVQHLPANSCCCGLETAHALLLRHGPGLCLNSSLCSS